MEWVETTGKTVEEAKEAALDELGVDEHDAEFEVLEEPRLGLFGRVRTEARVRARVRPTAPRAKEDRRDRRRRSRSGAATAPEADSSSSPATATNVDTPDVGAQRARQDGGASLARPPLVGAGRSPAGDAGPTKAPELGVVTDGTTGTDELPAGPVQPAKRRRPRRRRSGQSRPPGGKATVTTREDASITEDRELLAIEGDTLMDVALDEQGKAAEQFLTGMLAAFGVEATIVVETSDEEDRVEIRIDGPELGLLIGPKGATLLAIQELTRTAVVHRTSARNGHLYVDVAGYRRQRAVALAEFASKVARDVLAAGEPIALEPMNAADRKVVHDTVTAVEGVETRSVGEEDRRHVVLLPAGWTDGA